jgi:hypothetical protein
VTYYVFSPEHLHYGKFTGRISFGENQFTPDDFDFDLYKTYGGINYYRISQEFSSKYIAQIALTNQYHTEIASLSNFLYTANHLTTNTATYAAFQQMWWSPANDALYVPEEAGTNAWDSIFQQFSENEYPYPSILAFQEQRDAHDNPMLVLFIQLRKKSTGKSGIEWPFAFKAGSWRFVAEGF